ncbi:HEAT repeat domain-containing protein [Isachenkonia alkalipeptolytica]|nr:HEAT repeat domain-containing protein [Isachenkonia alkalipeptolytica]
MIRALKIKENLRKEFEKELADYISHKDQNRLRTPATKRERRVFEELILSYGIFLTGEAKERLLEVIGREHKIEEIRKKLKSSNPWRKRIATYQGGEFGLKEIAPLLLEQLKLKDRELLYITARALIKLEDRKYLKEILQAIGEDRSMEKNNVLVLVELVEGDIRDILEEIMEGSDSFLHALALEIYGKRQYMEGVPRIEKMVESPLKEIRIAALKGAAALGDIGDADYFNKIAALKTDEQWEVRAFLAKYLKYVKNGHGIEILGSLMKDSNWHVRTNAANALKEQGEEGLKILVAMMDSEDGFAADKATEVIQKEVIFHGLLDNLEEGTIKNRIVQNMEKELMEVGENIYG